MPIDFSKNRDKDIEAITEKLFAKLQKQGLVAEEIGEQVGESFADGVNQGFEDAASRITASSVKITKAFKDLAKKITNQKDIFNISLGGKDIILDIDFSDVDINSKDFQKKIDEVFEKFKIDNAIEFDSKTTEKHFKNMIGLHTKYAAKLSKLQEQRPRLTNPESIKVNAREQLAVIDGLKEVRRVLSQTSDMYLDLPSVRFGDVKELRDSIRLLEQLEKGEEKVVKQRSASVEKIRKENKELKERNKLLEEKVAPIEGEEVHPARKPLAKKPKTEVPVATGTDDSALQKLKRDADAASKAFENAEKKLSAIIEAEKNLEWQLTSRGFVDYAEKYLNASDLKERFLSDLPRSLSKKSDHKASLINIKDIIQNLINNDALGAIGEFTTPEDLYQFKDYKFAVETGATNKELNNLLNSLINGLIRQVNDTMDTYKSWGNIQSHDNPEADSLLAKKRKLAEEHVAATKAYNDAADMKEAAYKRLNEAENGVPQSQNDGIKVIDDQNAKLEERNRLVNEYVAALKRVREIESRYSKPADMSKEDLTTWSDSHEIMRGMSVRADYEDIKKGVAEKIGAEMTAFTKQYDSLAKEFGYSDQLFSGYNNLLIQIQQGALNAAEAVVKLREEMAARAAEEAFNAELEAAVAAEVEEELKAEQTQLDLTKEELKVEKEITKEKEKQYGYHAGKFRDDGFKAENLWQSTPGRSTGFYGTGTYMTDKDHLKEITTGQYGQRPLNVIDPDMYNLFDATNDKTADQLHQFLKRITNKAFGGKGENIKSLYAEFKELFPKEQIITYEDFKALVGELQQYVKDYGDKYPHNKTMDSVSTKFMKNFGYEGVDTRGTRHADTTYGTVIYDLKEESIVLKEITDEMQKQEIIAGNIASVIEGRTNVQKKNKFTSVINGKSGKFKIKKPETEGYTALAREDATGYIDKHHDHEIWDRWYSKSDDAARTQIADILENDLKMRNASLNQMWDEYRNLTGTDIKFEEFLHKQIPLYRGESFNSQSQSEKALSFSLSPQTAEEFGDRVLEIWMRPIDTLGMANPTYISQPEAEVMVPKALVPEYDDWHNSLMTPPQVEKEVQAKTKLAETNEKVAESQKKVNEAAQGVQMTIDDIVPTSADEAAPKVEEEANALDKVSAAAEKAANSKKKFAKANKEVSNSTGPSVKGLKAEADAAEEVAWSMTRLGTKSIPLGGNTDAMDDFNLPHAYMGEKGQDAVQMFAGLKSEIEEMTGKPVIIDFVSKVNDNGQLAAVGATLKYVNEEAGVTVKQFYKIEEREEGILVATQSQEKATLAASKAAKVFNTEMQQKLALEQIKTLEGQMGSLELDLTEVKNAARAINDKASLENFNLALRSAKEQAKQLKTELKGQNTLDTIASMERALLTLPSRLEEVQRRLKALGDIEGVDEIDDVLRSINDEYQRFLRSDDSEEKVKLFRELTSSMVWANAEMRNLSGKNAENKRQRTAATNAEDAQKKAARESYVGWWKTALDEQSAEESEVKARQKQEQAYSDWWQKALFDREQQEKAKDERVIAARKKKEEAYEAWWQKALYNKEKAPNLKYGKTTANAARRKLDSTEGAVDALGVTNPKVLAKLDAYRDKVKEVEALRETFASDSSAAEDSAVVKQFQKASYEAEQLRRGIKAITDEEQKMMQMSEEQGFDPMELTPDQVANLKNEMIAHAQATAQGRVEIKGWNDDHTKMYYTVTDSKGVVEEMTEALGQGTNRLYQYRTATKETGTLMQQIFKGIKVKAKELLSFVIGGGSVYKVIELLRQGIQYVREIDLALTELKKVTNETEESYDKFLKTAAKTAEKVGSTIKDVVSSTADWARLGYSMKEAAEFAESTQILMNVSEFTDISTATDTLISAVQAFGYTAETSMEVVDLMNIIGNNYAISTADLATSLTKSSASLVAAGGNLAEAAALTATANAIIQDADSVGTALKTTSLRLRGTSVRVLEEEGLDSDGAVESTSKLRSQVLALSGVDILTDSGAYKSTYQILLEIAEVWDQITDDKARAGLLELLAGKRNSSVIAALLQNPEQLKDAYEDANKASGSALKENEKYLDSIQGKIDQFNNAMQAMWSNALDSDIVKNFVAFGTEIIKIIDKIGLLNSALLVLGAYKGFGAIFRSLSSAGITVQSLTKQLWAYITGVQATTAAETNLTQVQLQQKLAQQGLTKENIQAIIAETGLGVSTDKLTKETLEAAMTTLGYSDAQKEATLARIFGTQATVSATLEEKILRAEWIKSLATQRLKELQEKKLAAARTYLNLVTFGYVNGTATAAEVQAAQAAVEAASVPVDITKIGTTELLGLAFKGLAASIWAATKAIWAFLISNPIGQVILIVTAVIAAVAAWNQWGPTTENLTERLEELKSELSDIRSELDSVNSELKTTNERMSELLAKDKLTFEEQEELDRLRATNDELERRKALLESQEESKAGVVGRQAARVVNSAKRDGLINNEYQIPDLIKAYAIDRNTLANSTSKFVRDLAQKDMDAKAEEIDEYISTLAEALDGVEYGDSEESDKALDYLAELQDTYAIARGSASAETNAIKGVFNKPEFEEMSEAINYYVGELKDGNANAAESIANIINGNEDLVEDLEARGVDAEKAIKYWTELGSNLNFSTLEGKTEEIKNATAKLPEALNDINQFMDGDKVDKTVVAEYFKGTSDKTREEITKLIQDINDGKIDIEHALKQFNLFGIQSVLEIEITEVQTNFKDAFPDLEGADGLINTFQELADAIGSTSKAMDALNAAQAEMNYSGRVSIETALKLMEYTDDYSKVLTISEGKLVLTEDAEENLVEARLEGMKASALKTLEEARAAKETMVSAKSNAEAALATYNASVETEMAAAVSASAWDKVLAAAAGLFAGIGALLSGGDWLDAYEGAYQGVLSSRGENRVEEVKAKYATEAEKARKAQLEKDIEAADKAIEEQDKEIERLQGNYDLVSGLNKDNIGDVFKSDDLDDPEDAEKKKLEELMERFQQEMDYWENRIGANQARYEQLQNEIDLLESKGQKADASYYQEQIALEQERERLLLGQKQAAQDYLEMIENAGLEGSEEWWEVANNLNDIEGELDDVTASILDLQDAIGEIDTYKFEEFNTRLDNLASKLGTIRDLIAPDGEEDWFDDEGNWTEDGVAVLGTYVQELETYKQGLAEVQDTMSAFNTIGDGAEWSELTDKQKKAYADQFGIHSEQEYYDKQEELINQQYDYMSSISDTEQSIVDMYESSIDAVEEYTETLIDGYNDYIDSVKEALDAERDLYDFKKNVQKQAKDIAEIERRIASLSGSTNAADIAERRKLEAQLYESRESLNDTYYDHAKDAQNEALDAEASAYEETMTKMVEGIRASLEEATVNMDEFLMGVTSMVMYNADTILTKYEETNLPLTKELTNPWEEAKKAVGTYSGDALDLMNQWTKEGGFFAQFNASGTTNLTSPWSAGTTAANTFKTSVSTVMSGVVSNISTNVQTASTALSNLYKQIQDTEQKAASANVTVNSGGSGSGNGGNGGYVQKKYYTTATLNVGGYVLKTTQSATTEAAAKSAAQIELAGQFADFHERRGVSEAKYENSWLRTYKNQIKYTTSYYAKGTAGTTHDEWAITNEPQFGDELTMYATPEGTLSFMRAGSTVVPADITKNLVEWGQFTPDAMNLGGGVNVNMINNAVNKPEFNFAFDALVKAENITEETLPAVKKLVTQELNRFTKELNYALKGKGAR